jgi:hypothetical protein
MNWNLSEIVISSSPENVRFNSFLSDERIILEAIKPNPNYPDSRQVGYLLQQIQTSVGEATGKVRRVYYGLRMMEFSASIEPFKLEFSPYYWTDPIELRLFRYL